LADLFYLKKSIITTKKIEFEKEIRTDFNKLTYQLSYQDKTKELV